MTTKETQAPDQEAHRLTRKMCGNITSWREWQELFESANILPMLLGLLHCAPNIGWSDAKDLAAKYCDLLELADGYSADQRRTFLSKEEQRHTTGDWTDVQANFRQEIAKKALWALSQSLFKDDGKAVRSRDRPWSYAVLIPEIYKKLLWFFDDSERRDRLGASNAVVHPHHKIESHPTKVLSEFLRNFLEFAWIQDMGNQYSEERTDLRSMLQESRPRLLRIFYHSENLDWFTRYGNHAKLSDGLMRQFKELILWADGKYDLSQTPVALVQRYATMNEAMYENAYGANIYVVLSILRREGARRQAEARREEEKREEEIRANRRKNLEKKKEQLEQELKEL